MHFPHREQADRIVIFQISFLSVFLYNRTVSSSAVGDGILDTVPTVFDVKSLQLFAPTGFDELGVDDVVIESFFILPLEHVSSTSVQSVIILSSSLFNAAL